MDGIKFHEVKNLSEFENKLLVQQLIEYDEWPQVKADKKRS